MTKARILADYVAGGTTATEFDYMDGVTSNVQTQLDAKLALAGGTMTGDLVPATPLSHRNMIINGGMQVWQRATSAVTATTTYDTADRWRLYDPSSGSFTSEKHTMAFGELNTTGHRTALKLACTGVSSAGASDHAYFYQALEGQDCQKLQYGTANAKTVTISFWVKSTITGTYCISVYADAATNYQVAKEYTISSADTWEYKTITITPTEGSTSLITSSGGLFDDNTSQAFILYFFLVSGSSIEGTANEWGTGGTRYATSNQVNWLSSTSNTFYITGIQLELGSSATPFEHRSFGDELQRCDRYYQKSFQYTTVPAHGVDGLYGSTTPYHTAICKLICHLSNPMRAVPDFTFYSSDSGASGSQVNSHDGSWGNHNANASGLSDRAFVLNFNHTGANTDETVLVNFNYEAVAEL